MKKEPKQTPLMQQYRKIKAKYQGAIVLFRVGDFYETFEDDAKKLHEITDVKLTKRSNGAASAVPLAGFPYHALDAYLPKLIQAGFRVAICDQVEPAKKGQGLVDRKVTELVTPGITYHDHVLTKKQNNYLASVHFGKEKIGIAFLDISTGEFLAAEGNTSYIRKLIQGFAPAEFIFNRKEKTAFKALVEDKIPQYMLEDWLYNMVYADRKLKEHFGITTLKGFSIATMTESIIAAGAILRYLEETEHQHLQHIRGIAPIAAEKYMWMDKFTIRNLELLVPQQEEGASVIGVLGEGITTPIGARRIRKWLLLPLKEITTIKQRLAMVDIFVKNAPMTEEIVTHLRHIGDLERLISKVASRRINPRELQALKKALQHIEPIKNCFMSSECSLLVKAAERMDGCKTLVDKITKTLQDNPPLQISQGGLIKRGIDAELDNLYEISLQNNDSLRKIQETERKETGISSLKIGYNKIFGYYLEVTHAHKNRVPQDWIRKQTLVNAERYVTTALKKYEEILLHAQERISGLEQAHYKALVEEAVTFIPPIQKNAQVLGAIDCYCAFAHLAKTYNYVHPQLNDDGIIDIKEGRHPVIEQCLPIDQTYVPNDIYLDKKQQILLITGPNMAGKSALLRQVALIVIMAHIGCFVPAKQANIGLVDKLFTRVGASDNIAKQESTFMVEMNEMARILNNLSNRSLIIVDELGRGTGTADGLALAQSIIEYIHNHPWYQAKTLFATHYHELNGLADKLPKLRNYKVLVKESYGKILFLHKLAPGGSQNSFGIQVAGMAGIPPAVIEHAFKLISKLKPGYNTKTVDDMVFTKPLNLHHQRSLSERKQALLPLIKTLKAVDVNTLSPIEALMKLSELQKLIPRE